jgi:hypothetical protein
MTLQKIAFIVCMGCLLSLGTGCRYSFRGISIPPDVRTYYVGDFQNAAAEAPGDINQRFAEALRAKVRNESRLIYTEIDPDIEFSGKITAFTLRPEALQAGNTVAQNKLEIFITVTYINNKDESKNWNQKQFSFFRTFNSDQDFISIQDGLITEIFDQILENIFNDAFTGW